MSLYVLNEFPTQYGPCYADFAAKSVIVVQKVVGAIKNAVDNQEELTQLFFAIIDSMALLRAKLAEEHRVAEPKKYGLRRDGAECQDINTITLFLNRSAFYEKRITKRTQEHLRPLQRTLKKFEQTALEVPFPRCCARDFKMQYDILNESSKSELITTHTNADYQKVCKILGKPPEFPINNDALTLLEKDTENMRLLKIKAPDLYKKFKLVPCLLELKQEFPKSKMSDWILATHRIELDGQMVALSQYLTWTYRNFHDDPIERMVNFSTTLIIRQDRFLIPLMLEKISRLFAQAIQCHRYDLAQIKQHTALMKYLFVHAMPYAKGTSSISEWLEQTVYNYHGYAVTYNAKKMPSYEALTLPWNEFYENYDSMYSLQSDINAPD